MYQIPNLLFADKNGRIYDHPTLKMTVRSGDFDLVPYELEMIELPECSRLYFMPDTAPVCYNQETASMETFPGGFAVSAFLDPGYLRLFLPAYKKLKQHTLPLYAYTAVGWMNGKFVVPAIKIDDDSKWHPSNYDYTDKLENKVNPILEKYPHNRLYKHLANCALNYHCTAAKNVFYKRWECPIPTAPTCNSRCIGCISQQPENSSIPSPQSRIKFIPEPWEIAEVALNHYKVAKEPIISFGQGCEGDPIMVADVIAEAVKLIKKSVPELTVNFNSNCSKPEKMKMLYDAGLDSIRVSLNSVVENTYNTYYKPVDYKLDDVFKSIELAKKYNVYVALNLLTMPGINDRESETMALIDFINTFDVNLIQMRNLNIDPDMIMPYLNLKTEEIFGIKNMLKLIKKKNKKVLFGYFNRTKKNFYKDFGYPNLKRR